MKAGVSTGYTLPIFIKHKLIGAKFTVPAGVVSQTVGIVSHASTRAQVIHGLALQTTVDSKPYAEVDRTSLVRLKSEGRAALSTSCAINPKAIIDGACLIY